MPEITTLESENFNAKVKDGRQKVAVLFAAEWCEICRTVDERFNQAQKAFSEILFYRVDVDVSENLASQNEIPGIPAVVMFRNGEETAKMVGKEALSELETALAKMAEKQHDTKK